MGTPSHPNRTVRVKDLNRFKRNLENSGGTAYHKPAGGIPYSDLSAALQAALTGGTKAMLTAGTDQTDRIWQAKILKEWFAENYLIPVDMDSLTLQSTFVKGNIVAINGVMYRAKTDTSNFPITLMTQDGNFLYNEVNGHKAYIVADYTMDSDWEVWTDAGIDYHIERAEQLYPLSGSGAPTVVPAFVGQLYVDTSTPKLYCAKRVTGSTSDWFAV